MNDQEMADARERDTALDRARGHVAEIRRLHEQGAPVHMHLPLLDQIEADLNTLRSTHEGYPTTHAGAPLYADGTAPTGATYGTGPAVATETDEDGRGVHVVSAPAFAEPPSPDDSEVDDEPVDENPDRTL